MAEAARIYETVTEQAAASPAPLPARCYGQIILDRCPLREPLDFSILMNLRPLGSIPEESWMDLLSRVPAAEPMTRRDETLTHLQTTHQCALLTVWLPFAHDLDDAIGRFNSSAASYVLAAALWFSVPCEPVATVVVDTATNETWSRMGVGRPLPAAIPAANPRNHFARVMPGLLADGRMRLLAGMYRDVLVEPLDSAAIVKAWTLLETAAVNEDAESPLDRVRSLCERVGADADGQLLRQWYESSGRDLIQAAHLHRDCIVRHGWCNPRDKDCMRSPCRHSSLLRLDLQMFLAGFVTSCIAISGWGPGS
jgi:hypothetical protein